MHTLQSVSLSSDSDVVRMYSRPNERRSRACKEERRKSSEVLRLVFDNRKRPNCANSNVKERERLEQRSFSFSTEKRGLGTLTSIGMRQHI